jgi:gliding motility-associated-like protein
MIVRNIFIFLVCLGSSTLFAQPFRCKGDFILAISENGDSTNLFYVNVNGDLGGTITLNLFSDSPSQYVNAIGYRWTDNYVYGIAVKTRDLYRIDASGSMTFLHHLDEFDENKTYNAGDVSIDCRYLVVLSAVSSGFPWRNQEIILIDLESPGYPTTIIPITTVSGNPVYALDIAFDPISGNLYGFDGQQGRLIRIDAYNGAIDDETYEAVGVINLMAALFFDSFGNLYGYAKHLGEPGIKALYKIDIDNGEIEFLLEGPVASGSDGCSCPYRLELLKSVEPQITPACSEACYTFVISNASFFTQADAQLEDLFPPGFEILSIEGNIFDGQVSGLNSSNLVIKNMSIPTGIDSFKVTVTIRDIEEGHYESQAKISNLSPALGTIELSDDPATIAFNDPTSIEVANMNIDSVQDLLLTFCPGDTLELDATITEGLFNYTWENGFTGPSMKVTEAGQYEVIAENECETIIKRFAVEEVSADLNVELGPDRELFLGDYISLIPEVTGDPVTFHWGETSGTSMSCFDCESQHVSLFENNTYYVTVTDQNGCTASDSLNVIVKIEYKVFLPNIFSPNGDGVNDLFYIQGNKSIRAIHFQIRDRWGGALYEKRDIPINDASLGWDGQSRGKAVAPGVYVWSALVRFINGEEKYFSGNIMLVH